MKKILISFLLTAILLVSFTSTKPAVIDAADIRVMIDGIALQTDVAPQIIDSRVLIPFRAIFESLDVQVYWDSEKRYAVGKKEGVYVEIPVDKKEAYISGTRVILDTSATIVNGRILLPLRFVAEILGAHVLWCQDDREVTISTKDIKVPDEIITRGFVVNRVSGARLDLEMQVSVLRDIMGEPCEIYPGDRGFYWYLYNSNSISTIHVGVDKDRVVAFSTNSPDWKYTNDLTIGQSLPSFYFNSYDEVLHIYHDELNQNKVMGYVLYLKEVYGRQRTYSDQVTAGMERMLFDYMNTTRAVYGKIVLDWCNDATRASLKHSIDMGLRLYFSHTSPEGVTMGDRLRIEGIKYHYAGENISYSTASQSINPLCIHSRWMNSSGHRKNILNDMYQYTGIGIANSGNSNMYIYATQKYYSLR